MPYKYGHYFVGMVLLVILVGFWPSYFTLIGKVPLAFHFHAATASSWVTLLLVQSVAIHARKNAIHRTGRQGELRPVPAAHRRLRDDHQRLGGPLRGQESPFIAVLGPSFRFGMVIAIAAYLTLFHLALKNRRTTGCTRATCWRRR